MREQMHKNFETEKFLSVSVVLPVMTETESLIKTFEIIEAANRNDVLEYLLIVCQRTEAASLQVCESLVAKDPSRVRIHFQTLPFLGGAMRESFKLANGSHVIMMASDLETDPDAVATMIAESKANPNAIITASRWLKRKGFRGYNPIKLGLNFIFQKLFSVLYRRALSDMTYGYRLFPTKLVKAISWNELRHSFLFETIIKPLRLGVPVKEISTVWKAREQGNSQNTFLRNFEYFSIGLKVLFSSKDQLLVSER
jgi:hypothetical protein